MDNSETRKGRASKSGDATIGRGRYEEHHRDHDRAVAAVDEGSPVRAVAVGDVEEPLYDAATQTLLLPERYSLAAYHRWRVVANAVWRSAVAGDERGDLVASIPRFAVV